jgi:hypothetical protein
MIRRFPWRMLFLGALCLVPAGCEPHNSWLRRDDDDKKAIAAESGPDKVIGKSSDDQDASNFFANDRPSGGLSRTARSIERDLGAY